MQIDPWQLIQLVTIIKCGFLVAVAAMLNVAQPAFSESMKKLEERLSAHTPLASGTLRRFLKFAKSCRRQIDLTPDSDTNPTQLAQFVGGADHFSLLRLVCPSTYGNPNFRQSKVSVGTQT